MKRFVKISFIAWLIICVGMILFLVHFPDCAKPETNTAVGGIMFSILAVIPAVGFGTAL